MHMTLTNEDNFDLAELFRVIEVDQNLAVHSLTGEVGLAWLLEEDLQIIETHLLSLVLLSLHCECLK